MRNVNEHYKKIELALHIAFNNKKQFTYNHSLKSNIMQEIYSLENLQKEEILTKKDLIFPLNFAICSFLFALFTFMYFFNQNDNYICLLDNIFEDNYSYFLAVYFV